MTTPNENHTTTHDTAAHDTAAHDTADKLADFAVRTQEQATAALRGWAESVQQFVSSVGNADVPDTQAMVDRWFDAAQKVLDQQRTVARDFAASGAQAAGSMSEQAVRTAETVTRNVIQAAEAAAAAAQSATRSVAAQAGAAADRVKDSTTGR